MTVSQHLAHGIEPFSRTYVFGGCMMQVPAGAGSGNDLPAKDSVATALSAAWLEQQT